MTSAEPKTIITGKVLPSDITKRLVEMWLHGLSPQTQERYQRTARRFLAFVNKPLHLVTLADIQGWQLTMAGLSSSSQRTATATIKSLLSFGHKIGVLPENVGLSMRLLRVLPRLPCARRQERSHSRKLLPFLGNPSPDHWRLWHRCSRAYQRRIKDSQL